MDQIIAMPNLACLKRRGPVRSPSKSPQDIWAMTKRKTSTPTRERNKEVNSVLNDSVSPF